MFHDLNQKEKKNWEIEFLENLQNLVSNKWVLRLKPHPGSANQTTGYSPNFGNFNFFFINCEKSKCKIKKVVYNFFKQTS